MTSLAKISGTSGDVLEPYGELDVLPYYGQVAGRIAGFLHGRELATRIWAPPGRKISAVVISGATASPLFAEQLTRAVTPDLIEARQTYNNPEEAGHVLSPEQRLAWTYFPKRRYIGLYHAPNRMGPGREIGRVIYDLEPCVGSAPSDLLAAVRSFIATLNSDDRYPGLFQGDPFICWTGEAFQVTLFTRGLQPASFYRTHLEYTGKGRTLTDAWVDASARAGNLKISGGSQRRRGYVLIDSARTPSGKLSPLPLGCITMTSATQMGGVSVPLRLDMLDNDVLSDLVSYTPDRIIDELDELAARLPVSGQ